jgi:3-oxoacyl-(acyl-carrier-protein) synthase
MLISNACAAGGSSIARAVELLRAGRCDRVLAMGYDTLSPFTHAGFGSLQALSRGTTRPFGTGRDGMKLGDGFAALHLELPGRSGRTGSTDRTDRTGSAGRVVPMVLGYGESADAHHLTHPHPEGLGAALAMQRALVMAGLEPGAIDYINCHGTATPSNDRAEALALEKVFGEELPRISINASKPNFGHTLGGAGAVEAVVTLLVLRAQQLPPTLNIDDVEPEMKSLRLVREGCRVSIKNGMSNSFGFGGCNVSLIFGLRPLTEGGGE